MKRANGFVLYHGPSLLDPSVTIVVIVTGTEEASDNPKTGPMLQVWILRADRAPHIAARDGSDAAICGSCAHRAYIDPLTGKVRRPCYVIVHNAPRAVWACWKRGGYPEATAEDRRMLANVAQVPTRSGAGATRFGAYGDPAAVPIEIWEGIMSERRTGYSHQWRDAAAQPLRRYFMASVDSPQEAQEAQAMGWRTFRVRTADEPLLAREIACPAAPEGGERRTCETCRACVGNPKDRGASVAIIVHGSGAKHLRREARLPVVA
jgi:hypothetical protein